MTAKEFAKLPEAADDSQLELVRGRVVVMPRPGFLHGVVQATLVAFLVHFVHLHRLGRITVESGLQTEFDPDTVRGPDIAFWSKERIPLDQVPKVYPDVAADLTVEIRSPSNTKAGLDQKVREYLKRGVRLVWLVDPKARTVTVYRKPGKGEVLRVDDELSGDDVLPGFTCPIAELFA
jgi:Uma2 family endonuclease